MHLPSMEDIIFSIDFQVVRCIRSLEFLANIIINISFGVRDSQRINPIRESVIKLNTRCV